jgi:hypothetical protein
VFKSLKLVWVASLAGLLWCGTAVAEKSFGFQFSGLSDEQKTLLRNGEPVVLVDTDITAGRYTCLLTYAKGNDDPVSLRIGTLESRLEPTRSWKTTRRVNVGILNVEAGKPVELVLSGTACSLRSLEFVPGDGANPVLEELLHSSIDYYDKLLRLPNGIYRNVLDLRGRPVSSSSTATLGVGLISLCINHELGRDPAARDKALQSLRAINGKADIQIKRDPESGFFVHFFDNEEGSGKSEIQIKRDPESGFFVHFFDNEEGSGKSEISTIDTSIMMSGAICCRNTFNDDEINKEVDKLFFSIKWTDAVANREKMQYYTIVNGGVGSTRTLLFNEYLILAWLCDEYERALEGSSDLMPDIADLPTMNYKGIEIPTEPRQHPLSSFVIQFPFYMCDPCANDPLYLEYMIAYAKADELACRKAYGKKGYWGCGAGQMPAKKYVASNFLNNPGSVVSPRIIAGFMPVYAPAVETILTYAGKLSRRLETDAGILLPRFSMEEKAWQPDRIESIDFSSMLFGTAAMHPRIGLNFFRERFRFTVKETN